MMNIQEHEGKFHVMKDDDVLGVFRTRRGALGFMAEQRQQTMIAGPWANAARRSQAAQVVHVHDPLEEGLKRLVHIHEFDDVYHTHPGYGPGRLDMEDEAPDPSGVEI